MKDERLAIGFDVDGVFSDFVAAYRKVCEKITGRDLSAPPSNWGMDNWGLTPEETKKAWEVVTSTEDFYVHLKPYEESEIFNLYKLESKYKMFFITTRATTVGMPMEKQTAYWLSMITGIEYPTVVVTDNKGEIAAALGLVAFIDDRPENLRTIAYASPDTKLFLRDGSWNQDAEDLIEDFEFVRVWSLAGFLDEFEAQLEDERREAEELAIPA